MKEENKFLHTDGWRCTPIKGSTRGPRGPKKREGGKYLEEGNIWSAEGKNKKKEEKNEDGGEEREK